jgi:hypothetical protein
MENATITFRLSSEQKKSLTGEAKASQLTLTQYILWIFDMYEMYNSMSFTQKIVGKSDAEVSEILKDSESKFRAEFENEISKAYEKGYQHGRNEVIRKNIKN